MSTPVTAVSPTSYHNALSDISSDSSDDEPLATKCIKKEVETLESPRNGIFDILKNGTENVNDDSFDTVINKVSNDSDTIGNDVKENVEDCVSKELSTNSAMEIKSEESRDIIPFSVYPNKGMKNVSHDVQISAEQNSEGVQKGNENSCEESSECQDDSALSSDKLEVNNTASQSTNSASVENSSGNITSGRSERKAKSFARIRLVLAHEQIVDDDNFLGFTNTRTYRPPKKKKVLCPFKADKNYVKPKTVPKSPIKVLKETKTITKETKEVPKETKTVTKVTKIKQKNEKSVTKIKQKNEKTVTKTKQKDQQTVAKVTNQIQKVTKKITKITKSAQKAPKTLQKVTKTVQKASVPKQAKKLKGKAKTNTGIDHTNCTQTTTVEESLPEIQNEAVSPAIPPVSKSTENKSIIAKPKLKMKSELFSCQKCHYKTRNKYYIKRHQMTHNRPRISYECHYCEFVTRSLIVYKEHEARHTKAKPFKCLHCDYCSRSHTDFQRHQAKHSTEKKFKCPLCDFTTKWSRNVRHHILRHNTARPHKCHICGFSFKRMQDLKYHLYRHTDLKPISCDTCDFKCKTNYELRCHKLKHSDERFFSCLYPGCTQQTKTRSDLTKHMNIHNPVKNFICDVCQKAFNTKSCLAKHVRIHGEREPLRCDICQKLLKTRGSLHSHLKIHQGIYPFECDICLKKFSVKYNLIKHQETHMLNDRPYRCPICPHGARVMEHLLAHIGSMHGKSYAYFCEICRKPFKRYGQLKTHMGRMHSTSLDKTTVPAMQSMLREMNTNTEINLKHELNDDTLEFVQVKQEPLELYPGDITEVSLESIKSEPVNTSQSLSTASAMTQDLASNELNLEALIPSSVSTIDETSKSTITSDMLDDKPLATVGIYNGVTLPLATKGFEFNLEKRGKKPKSWFMNPKHMDRQAAAKHKRYLHKKEWGLIPKKKAKLPTNKMERETERMQRRLQKYITSCSLSTKNETTLIFHTDRNQSEDEAKQKKSTWLPRKNTVAALLLESMSEEPEKSPKLSSENTAENTPGNTTPKGIKRKTTAVKKPMAKKIKVLKSTKKSDIAKSISVATDEASSVSNVSKGEQLADKMTGFGKVIKKKPGRPKGSKNKKLSTVTSAKTLLQVDTNSSMSQSCLAVPENIQENLSEKTVTGPLESIDVLKSPVPVVDIYIDTGTENSSILREVSPGEINPENETVTLETKIHVGKTAMEKKGGRKGARNIAGASVNAKSEIEASDPPKKKKPGRPKGSVNKKKTATKEFGEFADNENISVSVTASDPMNVCAELTENIQVPENNELLTNVTNIKTEKHLFLRPCSVTLENLSTAQLVKVEPFLETCNEDNYTSEISAENQTVLLESQDALTKITNGVEMIPTSPVKPSLKKKREQNISESKNEKQIMFSEAIEDIKAVEFEDDVTLSQVKHSTNRKSIPDISETSEENQIVSVKKKPGRPKGSVNKKKTATKEVVKLAGNLTNENISVSVTAFDSTNVCSESTENTLNKNLIQDSETNGSDGNLTLPPVKKSQAKNKKPRPDEVENLNENQIVSLELLDSHTDSVKTETVDKKITSPVNHTPKKKRMGVKPGPKKRKHDIPGTSNENQIVSLELVDSHTDSVTTKTIDKMITSPVNHSPKKKRTGGKPGPKKNKCGIPGLLSETESETFLEIPQESGMETASTKTIDKIISSPVNHSPKTCGKPGPKKRKCNTPGPKKRKHDMLGTSNENQTITSETIHDLQTDNETTETDQKMIPSLVKEYPINSTKPGILSQTESETILEIPDGNINLSPVKKTKGKKPRPYKVKTSNENQIDSSELVDSHTDIVATETIDKMITSQVNHSPKKKPGPKKKKGGKPGPKKRKHDMLGTSNENQTITSETIHDLQTDNETTETDQKMIPSLVKEYPINSTNLGILSETESETILEIPDGNINLSPVKKTKGKKPRPDKVKTSNENQIDSLELVDSHTDIVATETIDKMITSQVNHSPKKKPGPKKKKCGKPGPKKRKHDMLGTSNENQSITSETIHDLQTDNETTETDQKMIPSLVKEYPINSTKPGILSETESETILEIPDGNINLSPVKKTKDKKPKPDKVKTSNKNQIVSSELVDSHTDIVATETIDKMITSPVNHSPKKKRTRGKPGPKKKKCGIPGLLSETERETILEISHESGMETASTKADDKMIPCPVNHSPKKKTCGKPGPKKRKCNTPGSKKRKHDIPGTVNENQTITSETIHDLQAYNETTETDQKMIPTLVKEYPIESTKPGILSETESETILEIPDGNVNMSPVKKSKGKKPRPDKVETSNKNQVVSSELVDSLTYNVATETSYKRITSQVNHSPKKKPGPKKKKCGKPGPKKRKPDIQETSNENQIVTSDTIHDLLSESETTETEQILIPSLVKEYSIESTKYGLLSESESETILEISRDSEIEAVSTETGDKIIKSLFNQCPKKKTKRNIALISDENQTVSSDLLEGLVTDRVMVETGDAWMPSQENKSPRNKRKPNKSETKKKCRKTKSVFSSGSVFSRGGISEPPPLSLEEELLENVRVKIELDRNPGNSVASDNGFCDTITLKQETCAQNDDNNYLHNENFSDTFIDFNTDEDTIFNLSPSLGQDSSVDNSENATNNNLIPSEIHLPDFTL